MHHQSGQIFPKGKNVPFDFFFLLQKVRLCIGIIITTVIKTIILPVAFSSELTKQTAGSNACTTKDENSFSSESWWNNKSSKQNKKNNSWSFAS